MSLTGELAAKSATYDITFFRAISYRYRFAYLGTSMATRCVAFYSANAAIVDIINRQSSKHALVMLFGS